MIHLLVIGGPDACGRLLSGPGRAQRLTVVSPAAELSALPMFERLDSALALEDGPNRRVLGLMHARHRVTHVATFSSRFNSDAAQIANELHAAVYPELTGTAVPSRPRGDRDEPPGKRISVVVPVFGERGELQPTVPIARHYDPDSAEHVACVVPPDVSTEVQAEYLDRAADAARAAGLRTGVATVLLHAAEDDAVSAVETTVALPDATVRTLVQEAAEIDIADLAAQQAVGLAVLGQVRAALELPLRVCGARLVIGPPGQVLITGVDRAEALGNVRVEIVADSAWRTARPVRAIVWAGADDPTAVLALASRASRLLTVVREGSRWRG